MNIEDGLPDAQLFRFGMIEDYYEKIVQFFMTETTSEGFTTNMKKHLVVRATYFQLIAREIYMMEPDNILQ